MILMPSILALAFQTTRLPLIRRVFNAPSIINTFIAPHVLSKTHLRSVLTHSLSSLSLLEKPQVESEETAQTDSSLEDPLSAPKETSAEVYVADVNDIFYNVAEEGMPKDLDAITLDPLDEEDKDPEVTESTHVFLASIAGPVNPQEPFLSRYHSCFQPSSVNMLPSTLSPSQSQLHDNIPLLRVPFRESFFYPELSAIFGHIKSLGNESEVWEVAVPHQINTLSSNSIINFVLSKN